MRILKCWSMYAENTSLTYLFYSVKYIILDNVAINYIGFTYRFHTMT
jgi:hypothetical protein